MARQLGTNKDKCKKWHLYQNNDLGKEAFQFS